MVEPEAMKSGDGGPADDGGATAVSGSGKLDATQVQVVGHVMESMPGCCDAITDEQVSLPGLGQHQSPVLLTIIVHRLILNMTQLDVIRSVA